MPGWLERLLVALRLRKRAPRPTLIEPDAPWPRHAECGLPQPTFYPPMPNVAPAATLRRYPGHVPPRPMSPPAPPAASTPASSSDATQSGLYVGLLSAQIQPMPDDFDGDAYRREFIETTLAKPYQAPQLEPFRSDGGGDFSGGGATGTWEPSAPSPAPSFEAPSPSPSYDSGGSSDISNGSSE